MGCTSSKSQSADAPLSTLHAPSSGRAGTRRPGPAAATLKRRPAPAPAQHSADAAVEHAEPVSDGDEEAPETFRDAFRCSVAAAEPEEHGIGESPNPLHVGQRGKRASSALVTSGFSLDISRSSLDIGRGAQGSHASSRLSSAQRPRRDSSLQASCNSRLSLSRSARDSQRLSMSRSDRTSSADHAEADAKGRKASKASARFAVTDAMLQKKRDLAASTRARSQSPGLSPSPSPSPGLSLSPSQQPDGLRQEPSLSLGGSPQRARPQHFAQQRQRDLELSGRSPGQE